jgi:hypothetical protein
LRSQKHFLASMMTLALMLPACASEQPSTGEPVVTGAVQVTANADPVRAHATPLLARNPKNGALVAADVDVRGSRQCQMNISTNDGRSWFRGGDLMVAPFTDCSIGAEYGPHVMPFFDRNGVLFVVFTANDPQDLLQETGPGTSEFPRTRSFVPRNVYLARSTDDGRSFDVRLAYEGPRGNPHLGYNYAPVGAVDPEDPRFVYIGWTQGEWQSPVEPSKAVVAASSDGGKTFGAPFDISMLSGSEHPWLAVGGDGTVHAVHWSKGFGKPLASPNLPIPIARQEPVPIYYVRSTDHGQSWSRVEIDPGVQAYYRPPVIAADPKSDAVYVVWYSTAETDNFALTREGADRTDIYLRASLDGGETWQERRTVNDDAGKGINHSLPGVSIAPNGRLDIAWNDARNSPRPAASPGRDRGLLDIYYTSSTDQGATFAPSLRINDRSIDRSLGVWSNNVNAAVAVGIASADDAVYFAWQDTRAGSNEAQSEDVYSASLHLDGLATVASQPALVRWGQLAAGVAVGLGLAMLLVVAVTARSRGRTPAHAP